MEDKQQELIFKFSMYEQQIQQLNQQLEAVESAIGEIELLNSQLDDFKQGEGKEIFSPLGKGIFVKSKIMSNDFFVNIGERNFIKKDVDSTKETINKQIEKLEKIRDELNLKIEELTSELNKMVDEINSLNPNQCSECDDCSCGSEESCNC